MESKFSRHLFDKYTAYLEKQLKNKRFTHNDIQSLIHKAANSDKLKSSLIGKSIEQREIHSLVYGDGDTTVLLWSQMHGDEATATMALFDIFNFLAADDEFNEFRNAVSEKMKLVFVPMLNPDGAERITRQNAVGIDLNRDAARLESPESKILMKLVDEINPDFAFNLHDQDFRWSVGNSNKLSAISLLSPVYNYEKSINEPRLRALKLISDLREEFDEYIPGQIARYKDDYEPRSFGDLISGKGASTILIESGRDIDDVNKLFYRKINFMMILSAFNKIITKEYLSRKKEDYFDIPANGSFMYDLILKNAVYTFGDSKFLIDAAINREEKYEAGSRTPYFESSIMEIGDLRNLKGIEEYDCTGLELQLGKVSPSIYNSVDAADQHKCESLMKEGILFMETLDNLIGKKYIESKINLLRVNSSFNPELANNLSANFNLIKNGKIIKQVINGWLCEVGEYQIIKNALIL